MFASVVRFDNWKYLAEGNFGKVYLIFNVLSPIFIGERIFSRFVVKVAKTDTKGAAEDLIS